MVRTLKPLAILLLASGLAPITAFAQDRNCSSNAPGVNNQQTPEGNSIKFQKVVFSGSPALSASEQDSISDVVSRAAFKSRHELNEDLKSLVRDQWLQRGYFKVAVGEPEIKSDVEDGPIFTARVPVDAGSRYRLGELRFVKNTVFPSEKLRSLFSLQDGDIFNTHLVGEGMEEVRKLYADNGYINVVMVPATQMEKDADSVDLTMELDEGRQFRVGRVEVLSPDEAKRRQFAATPGLITGSIFNWSRLQKVFASRDSDAGEAMDLVRKINEADGTVDLKIDLRPCASVSQR